MNQNNSGETAKTRSRFRLADLWMWLACLLAAFVLWAYVMSSDPPTVSQDYPRLTVTLVGIEEVEKRNLAIYSGMGNTVDVTVSGKRSVISRLKEEDILVTADISNITDGSSYTVPVDVRAPEGCKVTAVSRNFISVTVDERITVYMDLTLQRDNQKNLPDGCYYGAVDLPTDKIMVTGPRSFVNSVKTAQVNLDLADVKRTSSITADVKLLSVRDEEITSPYLVWLPSSVTVEVPVYKKVTVPLSVDFVWDYLEDGRNCTVTLDPETVTLDGDPDAVDAAGQLDPIRVDERMEIYGGKAQKIETLSAPEGVTLSENQVSVDVTVSSEIRGIKITVPGENIKDTKARAGVSYEIDKRMPVEVTFMGPVEALNSLMPEDVELLLDMSPFTENNFGTSQVRAEVVVDSPYKDEVFALGVYDIAVTFTQDEGENAG